MKENLTTEVKKKILLIQQDELDSSITYQRLANSVKDEQNRDILINIAEQESQHCAVWESYTGINLKPNQSKINHFFWISKLLGLTFGIKLMERGEEKGQKAYKEISALFPEVNQIIKDEEIHETQLTDMIDEDALKYAGSVVLGLNDALVELTGTLAGLTFAFQNTNVIAIAGLITGIAAAFSMAASEYLSLTAEGNEKNPIRASSYTGLAYILTVIALILPYFLLKNYVAALVITILIAIGIIAMFNYYISVAKDYNFKERFTKMAMISLGVATFSFVIGNIIRSVFGINV